MECQINTAPVERRPLAAPPQRAIYRYGIAIAATCFGLGVRLALEPILGNDYAFLPFFGSIAVAVTFGGVGPGVVATVLSYLLADYFFIHPKSHLNLLSATLADWI